MGYRLLVAALAVLLLCAAPTANAQNVNRVELDSASASANPTIAPVGPDTNLGLVLLPKGAGGVGISTYTPQDKLEIYAWGNANIRFNNGAAGGAQGLDWYIAGSQRGWLRLSGASGNLEIANKWNPYAITFSTGFTPSERLRIEASGNVGIGTTAPVATLDVNGYAKLKMNAAQPVACSATYEGSIAYTGGTTQYMCFCNGSSWQQVHSPATACTW